MRKKNTFEEISIGDEVLDVDLSESLSLDDFEEIRNPEPKPKTVPKEILEYSLDGELLNVYPSLGSASSKTGISCSTINNCCRRYTLFSQKNNRIYTYVGEDIEPRLNTIQNFRIKKSNIYEYSLKGKLLYAWNFAKDAAKFHKVPTIKITNCCKGKVLYINKSIFLYPDENVKKRLKAVKEQLYSLSKKKPKYRKVNEYDLEGKYIKSFPSASAASREYGIHVSTIARCCNGTVGKDGYAYLTARDKIFLWLDGSISERLDLINSLKK